MKPENVNSFLWSLFLICVVVAMAAVVAGFVRSTLQPLEPSKVLEVPLTRGSEFPSSKVPGQMHVTLDRVGELDCVWIFKPELNDWLPIGGKGCPLEEVIK